MTLTPRSIRTDLKCGKGAIRQGQKCTKGAATPVEQALKVGGTLGAIGSVGYGLYAASKGNFARGHRAFAAAHGFNAVSASGLALQGKRTKNKNMENTAKAAIGLNALFAGTNVGITRSPLYRDSIWALGFQP